MKSYADLYVESPRLFLNRLQEDIKRLEARLEKLDALAVDGVQDLLLQYEHLGVLVEQGAYGVTLAEQYRWLPNEGHARIANTYPPETLPDGRWFVWSGPGPTTTFAAALKRDRPLRLTVEYMKLIDDRMASALSIAIDGRKLRHTTTPDTIEAMVPPRSRLSGKVTLITLDTTFTVRPGEGDPRELGIAFFGIRAELMPIDSEARPEPEADDSESGHV